MIAFEVRGIPITQGSKRAFVAGGRAHLVETGGAKHKGWRADVHGAAQDVAERLLPDGPLAGPIAVRLTFSLLRPKSAPKTRRTWPVGARSGDVDKLARSILDSMTGVIFGDDAQVVELRVVKDYSAQPGVAVEVFGPNELADLDARRSA